MVPNVCPVSRANIIYVSLRSYYISCIYIIESTLCFLLSINNLNYLNKYVEIQRKYLTPMIAGYNENETLSNLSPYTQVNSPRKGSHSRTLDSLRGI